MAADQITAFLVSHGPLGVLCIILLGGNRLLFKMYAEAQESRIKEARESQNVVQQLTAVIQALKDDFAPRRGR